MNIHVAHVVDGAIDTDFIRNSFPENTYKDRDGILSPEHIAETIGTPAVSRAMPGHSSWICVHGTNAGKPAAHLTITESAANMTENRGFLFRPRSPATYLAYSQLPKSAQRLAAGDLYRCCSAACSDDR